jgi:hypothetical protein
MPKPALEERRKSFLDSKTPVARQSFPTNEIRSENKRSPFRIFHRLGAESRNMMAESATIGRGGSF